MKVIYAKEYGILGNSKSCQMDKINEMLRSNPCDACYVLEPGEYHFYQKNAVKRTYSVSNSEQADYLDIAVLLENSRNIKIDGQGAVFMFHGDMLPLVIHECSQIEVTNLVIDFMTPLTAEARILRATPDEIEVYIDNNLFPHYIENETLMFQRELGQSAPLYAVLEFDAETNKVREGAGDTFPQVSAHKTGTDTIFFKGEFPIVPKPGNTLVLRHGRRIHPGALIQHSHKVALRHIKVHQTGGLGFVFQFNEDLCLSHISFTPNYVRGIRITSGHDDGLHFSNNKGTIMVEHCSFRGLMDDPINVHGTAACISQIIAPNRLRCTYNHFQSVGFEKWAKEGEQISLIRSDTRESYETARVLEYRLLSQTEFEIVLAGPIASDIKKGDAVENLTNNPTFICRNNYFGSCRARGVLVTTSGSVLIENNIFESSGSAILLAGDVNEWYETGTCQDVLIRKNQFLHCCTSGYQFCDGVIHIEPSVAKESKVMVHQNIQIIDNLFLISEERVLYGDHTSHVTMKDNSIFRSGKNASSLVLLEQCEHIRLEHNRINHVINQLELEIHEFTEKKEIESW